MSRPTIIALIVAAVIVASMILQNAEKIGKRRGDEPISIRLKLLIIMTCVAWILFLIWKYQHR